MGSCRRRPLKVRPSFLFQGVWFVLLISHGFNLGCPCHLLDGVEAPWSSPSTLALEIVIGGNRDFVPPARVVYSGDLREILHDAQSVILRRFCVAGLPPLD